MFARGVFSFHSAPVPASLENFLTPIIPTLARPSRKSNHSRTYGIPGGGGCTGFLVRPIRRASKPFDSPPYQIPVRNSFVPPPYAKTGGYTLCGKCRRADIFDFSPYILRFFAGRLALLAPIPSIEHRPWFWHFSLFTGHWSLATYAYFDSVCCTVPTRQKFCPVSGSV